VTEEPRDSQRFQLSLKSLIIIFLLASCEVGIYVYDYRIGIFTGICLVLSLGVIYFEKFTASVIVVCAVAAGLFLFNRGRHTRTPARPMFSPAEQAEFARMEAETAHWEITDAIEHYRNSKGEYPDDSTPQKLYDALQLPNGEPGAPRFLSLRNISTKDQEDHCLTNRMGDRYVYKRLLFEDGRERGFLLIDPGPDGKLGGSVDPMIGFIPDGSGSDRDNIVYDSTKPYEKRRKD
jgi:hypothetical protein